MTRKPEDLFSTNLICNVRPGMLDSLKLMKNHTNLFPKWLEAEIAEENQQNKKKKTMTLS